MELYNILGNIILSIMLYIASCIENILEKNYVLLYSPCGIIYTIKKGKLIMNTTGLKYDVTNDVLNTATELEHNEIQRQTALPFVDMVANEEELKWFFDHAIKNPLPNESYSFVLVSRHKKLTKDQQKDLGLTRKESEFLRTETLRLPKFKVNDKVPVLEFSDFMRHVRRLNFDSYAYTTATGQPIPFSTLAVLFYANPCDDIKVWDFVSQKMDDKKTALLKAGLAGKKSVDYMQDVQTFGNVDSLIKHAKAQCKGTVYWVDFDIDLPAWAKHGKFVEELKQTFYHYFGRGHFIMVDTSGGYHILCDHTKVKFNPHLIESHISGLYKTYLDMGYEAYDKFECNLNDSSIPGLPLPGTYQYGRPVTVANKEDFE